MTRRRGASRFRGRALAGMAVGAAAFAGAFTWIAGRRGFFAFDQSIPFDAGWRVLSGQVPYRDFVLPTGPVLAWLQAAGFAAFGVDYRGYLLTACAVAALASALAVLLTAGLFPGRRSLAIAAGLSTGLWFQAPAGTLWFEPVAYLAALPGLALWALDLAGSPGSRLSSGSDRSLLVFGAFAGLCLVAAALTKQSVALFLLPTAALLLLVEWRADGVRVAVRRAAAVGAGGLAAAGAFALWLALRSDPGAFARHVLRIPAALSLDRVTGRIDHFLPTALTGAGPPAPRIALLLLAGVCGAALLRLLVAGGSRLAAHRRAAVAAALTLGLVACQFLTAAVSRNQPDLSYGLAGLVAALGLGVARAWTEDLPAGRTRRLTRLAARVAGVVLCAVVAYRGWVVSLERTAHEGVAHAERSVRLEAPRLRPLRWAEPTRLRGAQVTAGQVDDLLRELERRPGGLFVFPDWTILYGLLGRTSPQPVVWFHRGLTYPRGGDPALDRRIVRRLEENGVATVVLESASWFGTASRRADFPALDAYLESCFEPAATIGPFRLLERVGGGARRLECRRAGGR